MAGNHAQEFREPPALVVGAGRLLVTADEHIKLLAALLARALNRSA
jgi:hypothetical protein